MILWFNYQKYFNTFKYTFMFHSEIFNLHKRLGIHFSLQIKLKSNINVKTHSVIYFVLVAMNTNQTYIFVY